MQAMKKELKKIPEDILSWFNDRGITNEVILNNKITYNNGWIVIPILDKKKKTIFKKFRREPLLDNTDTKKPKYKNELGATASLYGIHNNINSPIFITEGELDALCLQSYGLSAVSSTSGAGNFNPEWSNHLKGKDVFIVYDRDDAGFSGATQVQSMIPNAKIIILPDFSGKDITEYLKLESLREFLNLKSHNFYIPHDKSPVKNRKEARELIKEYKKALDKLVDKKQKMMNNFENIDYIEWLNDYLLQRYEQYKNALNRRNKRVSHKSENIKEIKQIPIDEYLTFNNQGFTKCIFHNDHNPSLYYNEPGSKYSNTVKCFSCGAMADVIDVVMELKDVDFKESIKILKNK